MVQRGPAQTFEEFDNEGACNEQRALISDSQQEVLLFDVGTVNPKDELTVRLTFTLDAVYQQESRSVMLVVPLKPLTEETL